MVTPDGLLSDLEKGKYSPVYFLFGEEPFFIDEAVDIFENHVLQPHEKDLNFTVCYGKEVGLADILNHAKRFPMMSDRQLVIVKEAQENSEFEKDPTKAPFLKHLDHYVTNPLPSTILVIAYKSKFDQRKAFFKTLDKHAVVMESKKIYDNQLEEFVKKTATRRNVSIDDKACKLLVENVGNNLSRLGNELTKVSINLKKGETITIEHIEQYVGISKEYNPFELQKALGSRDVLKSYKIALYLGEHPKENPLVVVVSGLYGYFSKILLVHTLKDKSKKGISEALRINPFFADEYLVALRNYPPNKVFQAIEAIHEADLKSKGIGADNLGEKDILMELTYRILA